MQPDGPYRYTHLLGGSPVGKAWAAVDGQGRFVTVAVLDATVAATAGWREAFAGTANSLAQAPGNAPFAYADFSAPAPWVAYSAEAGPAAEQLFRALGVDYQPVPTSAPPVSGPPQPVSGLPQSVSGAPQPVSGAPQPVSPVPTQPAYSAPISGAPTSPSSGPSVDERGYDPFTAPARRIQPSTPSKRRTGLWVSLASLVLVVALGSGVAVWALAGDDSEPPSSPPAAGPSAFPSGAQVEPGLRPWAQAVPFSSEERALAAAAPSLVFVEAVFTGYVRDASTNVPVRSTPIIFTRRCSAFVVNPDGHALTSTSCVQPTEENARQIALDAVARMLVRERELTDAEVPGYVQTNLPKVRFTGIEPDSPPAGEVFAQLNTATGNQTTSPAIPVEVVRTLPAEAGNTALIKLTQDNLPAVELNPSAGLEEGGTVLIIGFATTDSEFRTATYRPQSKLVTISGSGRRGPVSIHRISEDLGSASHGGVALDPSGRIAAMVDQDHARPDRANRVLLPASTVSGLLDEAGVENTLGDTDKLYRNALDSYFAGDDGTAIAELERVAESSPGNLLAQAYRQNAIERQQNQGTPTGGSSWITVLLVSAGAAVLVALIILVVLMARRRSN
ncbi:trypsin-like peptidase domain-containing protein [Micromonospora sp. NPDC000442]|uniref:trypsin-like peptidase domain-containing protein n=1 Tax=Micromonospora sp. NPDC000442 TaxID=3364217 RepID=UPI0036CCFE76